MPALELGLDTFGDITAEPDGRALSHAQVIRNVVDEAILADDVGIDFIGLGEHHRADFAISSPEVVLAAVAARTKRIHLGSAVTVLSSDDPIRVFQRFSTLDAISNGRAEVILGRGSFIESFPLFGFDLNQYEELFEEKLGLFAALVTQESVTWQGKLRPPLGNQRVFPPIEHGKLKTWIGVGGSPESVVRAAHYDFPLMLAIIGGAPARFRPFADSISRRLSNLANQCSQSASTAMATWPTPMSRLRPSFGPPTSKCATEIGRERGWPPMQRTDFERELGHGALHVGSPETVARKIATTAKVLGVARFDMKYSAGALSHDKMMRSIELYGSKVVPLVRDMLG